MARKQASFRQIKMSIKYAQTAIDDASTDIEDPAFIFHVRDGESFRDYKKRLLHGTFTISDFSQLGKVKIHGAPALEYHCRFLAHCSCCHQRPENLDTIIMRSLRVPLRDPGSEIEYVKKLINDEQNVASGLRMFSLLIGEGASVSDYIIASSSMSAIKPSINIALSEMRGTASEASTGIKCPGCGKETATMRPEQVRAGDEPTSMRITCSNPMCPKKEHIVG